MLIARSPAYAGSNNERLLCRYLIEQGCNLAAVNNDGELALDIAESDEMEDMLQQHINKAGLHLHVHSRRMSEAYCVNFNYRLPRKIKAGASPARNVCLAEISRSDDNFANGLITA